MPKRRHKISARYDQLPVHAVCELDVAIPVVVLPKSPDHECGLVFLNRNKAFATVPRRVPPGRNRSVSIIFLKKVAVGMDDSGAEFVEPACEIGIPGQIERVRDERAVAGPEITVVIRRPFGYVRIVRREDGTIVVDLCPDDQQRAFIKIVHLRRELAEMPFVLIHPCPPVVPGMSKDAFGPPI